MTSVCPLTEMGARREWSASSGVAEPVVQFVQFQKPNRLAIAWHAVVNFLVPIGYEDDHGFHYGQRQSQRELTWTI